MFWTTYIDMKQQFGHDTSVADGRKVNAPEIKKWFFFWHMTSLRGGWCTKMVTYYNNTKGT
jgi:hypothetical protein